MGVFSNAKDRLVEQLALSYLNTKFLGPYGQATDLHIDSTAKTIRIEVDLKGETQPLQVEITDYEITEENEKYYATVKAIRTSREWLTALATDQLINSRFELPQQAGRLLMKTL